MKRIISILLVFCMLLCIGCTAEHQKNGATVPFTDDLGRTVELPEKITKAAPSGAVAQMVLATVAPEKLCALTSTPDASVMAYLPEELEELPAVGQLYGSRSNFNLEALLASGAEVIIDLGQPKPDIAEALDDLQTQTGIPAIFLSAELRDLPATYSKLGELLGEKQNAKVLSTFIENALAVCEENRDKIPEAERVSVAFGTGPDGLSCNAAGSMQAEVIELVGAVNAVMVPEEELSNHSGGNTISMEQMYLFDPDAIIFSADGPAASVGEDSQWQVLRAVQEKRVYEIPSLPYSWMGTPPSVNRVLGLYWLGNLLYPEIYDYDMAKIVRQFYGLFWRYDMSPQEAEEILSKARME